MPISLIPLIGTHMAMKRIGLILISPLILMLFFVVAILVSFELLAETIKAGSLYIPKGGVDVNLPKIKVTFVREVEFVEQIPQKTDDGYKRTLKVTDKEGNQLYIEFKGAEKKHLLFKGLNSRS